VKQFSENWQEKYVDSESGELIICASGHSIWEDLEKLVIKTKWEQSADIMAVNDIGMHIPFHVKHWYSNDIDMLPKWRAARRPRFGSEETKNDGILLHSCVGFNGINWGWAAGGTSALGAVMTGIALGYEKIYLCGVPLDDGPHYFDPPWGKTNFSRSAGLRQWKSRWPYFEGKVVPMSGNLKELL